MDFDDHEKLVCAVICDEIDEQLTFRLRYCLRYCLRYLEPGVARLRLVARWTRLRPR